MVTKKDSIKRKRVEDAPASNAVKESTPAPTPAPVVEKAVDNKKKKVETPSAAPVQEPTTTVAAAVANKDKKTEKRKREEDTTSAAPVAATPTATKNTKKTNTNNTTNNKKADTSKPQENGDSVANGQPKKLNTIEPNHNLHLARKLNVVKCRVDLYKIPPQCIKVEPTETHFYVDTLKFTKKYLLNIPYPEGVHVDHTNVEATFDSGVLTCDIPIKSDPNKPKDHDKVVAAREQIKDMKQKGIPIPNDLIAAAKLAKSKADKSGESEDAPATDAAPAPKQKTPKKPLSNKERRQKEKESRPLNEDGTEAPRPKKAKAKKDAKKKKEFLANPEDALQVADQVNDQQEQDIQAKYDKEYAKLSYETRKKIENKEKKLKLREARKQELEKAIEKMPKKEKVTKKSSSKVSFAGDDE